MAIENVPQGGCGSSEKTHTSDARDMYDNLQKKLAQLHAMLTMTYGNAREAIDEMSDSLRDNYYWACADMAKDCGDLLAAIPYPSSVEVSNA